MEESCAAFAAAKIPENDVGTTYALYYATPGNAGRRQELDPMLVAIHHNIAQVGAMPSLPSSLPLSYYTHSPAHCNGIRHRFAILLPWLGSCDTLCETCVAWWHSSLQRRRRRTLQTATCCSMLVQLRRRCLHYVDAWEVPCWHCGGCRCPTPQCATCGGRKGQASRQNPLASAEPCCCSGPGTPLLLRKACSSPSRRRCATR